LARYAHAGSPSWPPFEQRQTTPLFLGREPLRTLVILLDSPLVDPLDESRWSKEWLLAGLITLGSVELFRYADNGPPADVPRDHDGVLGERVVGWAVLGQEEVGTGHRSVRYATTNRTTETSVMGNGADVAAGDTHTEAYTELGWEAASARRRADAVAAQVAGAIDADIFITNRPYLHKMTWTLADGVTYCTIDDALAIIGLYLRSQGSFVVSRDPAGRGTHTMNRGLYYWVGTRELLPAAWRWFSACVQHSVGSGDDRLLLLGQSVLQRVARALQVRDDVHVALNKPQNNDTADEALSSLDVVLLLLMGAVDATARVVHAILNIYGPGRRAGWQRADWLSDVSAKAPSLAALFQNDAPGATHALTILRLLRNSIHGEALPALGVGQGRERDRTLVGLPRSDEADLLAAFNALGGMAEWGVEEAIPGRIHADPGILLENLLPRVVRMLNEIMDGTPVEQLAHVQLEPGDGRPPADETFRELNRQSIRWQLGLPTG
jgi:hypothetical protein